MSRRAARWETLMAEGSDAWARLGEAETNQVWDRFSSAFAFRASATAEDWPGIREPVPSITWDLARTRPGLLSKHWRFAVEPADLHTLVLAAFRDCTGDGQWSYALDWQHPAYRFWPHRLTEWDRDDAWEVPVFPDGDYYAFMAPDFSFGTFGHPWEASFCVFGAKLLGALETHNRGILNTVIRRDGKPC
jgi:hypothetical protein